MPNTVEVGNVGANFMTENVRVANCTKHVDNRYHFIYEFIEDGMIRIVFKTSKNRANLLTKNVSSEYVKVKRHVEQ